MSLVLLSLSPVLVAELATAFGLARTEGRLSHTGLIAGAIALSFGIAWMVGRRAITRPADRLIAAAARWRAGDLDARVETNRDDGSELAVLARAFNVMADIVQERDTDRTAQADALERRVTERTHELSQSHNRLQVEIAERERSEWALQQGQKLQAVGQLAGGIAHDFNNMLATILGNLELLERRLPEGEPRLRQWTARAIAAVLRGSQLTSQLLAFSRRQRFAAQPTDLNKLVIELALLAESMLGRSIKVVTELSPEISLALLDRSQVEAAIFNLVLNARDAMPKGGALAISTRAETIVDRQHPDDPPAGDYVAIVVKDTGVGMTADVLTRAFEPFFTTKGPAGSGLGLSQVYGIARQSGGTARLRSAPGQGTEVTLLFPAATVTPEAHRDLISTHQSPPLWSRSILLVEDDAAVSDVATDMLRDLGCDVVKASNGAEALGIVAEQGSGRFDVMILDYAMPGMNGLELAAALRARGVETPLLMATGYAEFTSASSAGEAALSGILRKPFTLVQLRRALTQLNQHRPEPADAR